MATPAIIIDPKTGERIDSGSQIQIDPTTGERISSEPPTPQPKWYDLNDPGANQAAKDLALGIVKGAQNAYTAIPSAVGNALNSALGHQKPQRVIDQENYEKAQNGDQEAGSVVGSIIAPMPAVIPGGSAALEKLPSMEKAGGLLQSVAHDANKIPVQLDNAGDAALRLMDWQKKTQLGPTVNKFLNRITNPKLGPMTYEEARDYYQLLGKLSADEASKLSPPVRRDLVKMVTGLKADIGNAAEQVGRAADYYKGMQDYATAAKHQEWYEAAKDWGIKAGLGAAGLGGLGTLWQYIEKNK